MGSRCLPVNRQSFGNIKIGVALNDYEACEDYKLSFEEGEYFELFYKDSNEWWYAKSEATKLVGLIPSENIAIVAKKCKMHFSFAIFMAILDVALIIYERYVEVMLLIQY